MLQTQKDLDKRLARIEGQIRGIRKMISSGVYCNDVLTQVVAARSALDKVGAEVIVSHVKSCIVGHGTETEHERAKTMIVDEMILELKATLSRLH